MCDACSPPNVFPIVVVSWRQYDSGVIAELSGDPVASADDVAREMGGDGK